MKKKIEKLRKQVNESSTELYKAEEEYRRSLIDKFMKDGIKKLVWKYTGYNRFVVIGGYKSDFLDSLYPHGTYNINELIAIHCYDGEIELLGKFYDVLKYINKTKLRLDTKEIKEEIQQHKEEIATRQKVLRNLKNICERIK